MYIDSNIDCLEIPLEQIYSYFINEFGLEGTNLSKNGIDKINYLTKEYIKSGWNIDFVTPIIFNSYTKRLEYLDEFLSIKKMSLKKQDEKY